MLYGTQLSFIQLCGGLATGVVTERRQYYKLLEVAKLAALDLSTIAVCTITQFCSHYLIRISPADVEYWKRPLRYHYCRLHDLLCGFPDIYPSCSEERSISFLFMMAAFAM